MESKIISFFETAHNKPAGSLTKETRIREDLGGKSIFMVAVVANVEEEYDVLVSLPEASKAKTIGEFIDLVQSMIKE